jgi:hypothetical protein
MQTELAAYEYSPRRHAAAASPKNQSLLGLEGGTAREAEVVCPLSVHWPILGRRFGIAGAQIAVPERAETSAVPHFSPVLSPASWDTNWAAAGWRHTSILDRRCPVRR